jgi:hypothetical protein
VEKEAQPEQLQTESTRTKRQSEKGQEHDRLAPYPRRRASVGSRLRPWTGQKVREEEQDEGWKDERDVRRRRKRWCAYDVKRPCGHVIATVRVGVGASVGRIREEAPAPTLSAENEVVRR